MLTKLKIQADETLRFNPAIRSLLALSKIVRAPRGPAPDTAQAARIIHHLCQSARLAPSDALMLRAEAAIQRQLPTIDPGKIPWADFLPDFGPTRINKAVILKRYVSPREKGVVFISFDNQMARLALSTDLRVFAERYTLVLSPQWCPPHTITSYLFPLLYPEQIFCLISNTRDLTYFPRINNKYVMVPLYASNWVDPHKYTPVAISEKDIDIFMLANFAKYKRHHAFFAALRDLPSNYRVVLNGQRESGRTRETLLQEAAAFGVRDRFEIHENVTDQQLHNNFVRARISLILSRREGSCVAVVESMFANTPVGLYEDAEVGSKVFVNDQTGRLLQHHHLAAQLKDFVECSAKYEPRRWVMENQVSCLGSSEILNQHLRQHALNSGQEWTEDIAILRWRPNPEYYDPSEAVRLSSSYLDIEQRCGISIGPERKA